MPSDSFNTGQQNVQNATSSGQGAINSFDPNSWNSTTQSGLGNLWNQQGTTQNNYFNAYKNAISSNPTATDYYNKGNQMFNVQGLQGSANNLNNTILQTPNSNLDAAKGFNFDSNQVDQKTSQDLQRLEPAAQAAQNNATTAQGNAMNFANMGMQQNTQSLLPIQQQGQYLMDAYARQQSGFSTAQQDTLNALQQKMQSGVGLSSQEMQSYQALTSAEQQYQAALNTNQAALQKQHLQNQFLNPTPGSYLVNTKTGVPTKY